MQTLWKETSSSTVFHELFINVRQCWTVIDKHILVILPKELKVTTCDLYLFAMNKQCFCLGMQS